MTITKKTPKAHTHPPDGIRKRFLLIFYVLLVAGIFVQSVHADDRYLLSEEQEKTLNELNNALGFSGKVTGCILSLVSGTYICSRKNRFGRTIGLMRAGGKPFRLCAYTGRYGPGVGSLDENNFVGGYMFINNATREVSHRRCADGG